jgi:hypothetical protein
MKKTRIEVAEVHSQKGVNLIFQHDIVIGVHRNDPENKDRWRVAKGIDILNHIPSMCARDRGLYSVLFIYCDLNNDADMNDVCAIIDAIELGTPIVDLERGYIVMPRHTN